MSFASSPTAAGGSVVPSLPPSSLTSLGEEGRSSSLRSTHSRRRRRRGSDVAFHAKINTLNLFDLAVDPAHTPLLDMELRDLEDEGRWLLNDEWGQMTEALQELMREGLRVLAEGVDGKGEETLALTTQNMEAVKGITRLSEGSITKADLTVRLVHVDHQRPFQVAISDRRPFQLPQYQLARDRMELIQSLLDGLPAPLDLARGAELAENLLDQVRSTLTTLTSSGIGRFPSHTMDAKDFASRMSPKVNVEFYLDGEDLVCGIRCLKMHPRRPGGYRSLIHGWVDPPITFAYGDQFCEVVDEVLVRSKVPSITRVWGYLEQSSILCESAKEKIAAMKDAS